MSCTSHRIYANHERLLHEVVCGLNAGHHISETHFATHSGYSCWTVFHTSHILTHWGRTTHIYISKRQAIIWNNAVILLIGPLRPNFSEMLIKIHSISFKKMRLTMSSGKRWPTFIGLNVLIYDNFYEGISGISKNIHRNNIPWAPLLTWFGKKSNSWHRKYLLLHVDIEWNYSS